MTTRRLEVYDLKDGQTQLLYQPGADEDFDEVNVTHLTPHDELALAGLHSAVTKCVRNSCPNQDQCTGIADFDGIFRSSTLGTMITNASIECSSPDCPPISYAVDDRQPSDGSFQPSLF